MNLSDQQQRALQQIRDLTDAPDDDLPLAVLQSVAWDVHKAADVLFASPPAPANNTSPVDSFQLLDDDEHRLEHRLEHRPEHPPCPLVPRILAFPFHVLSSILRFIFTLLRIPVPHLSLFSLRPQRTPRPTHSRDPDTWLRDLEEETGAISISRYTKLPTSTTTTTTTSTTALHNRPSSLTSRTTTALTALFADALAAHHDAAPNTPAPRKLLLPDFFIGPYEDALRSCDSDARIGCFILVTDEHDDTPEFKRSTLTNPVLVKSLHDNAVLVWAADVTDRDGWAAAEKLQATTFPFVAFVALQPRRHVTSPANPRATAGSTAPSVLTVLSRHQGAGQTSAQALLAHFERQVVPRVLPYLERVKGERAREAAERGRVERERERERALRAEQDRAFVEAQRRDRERAAAAERERRERDRAESEEKRRERDRAERDEKERARSEREERERRAWRSWIAGRLELAQAAEQGGVKLAIRMPDSRRVVETFAPEATLTTLYAAVDAKLITLAVGNLDNPGHADAEKTVEQVLDALLAGRAHEDAAAWWRFRVVNAYPREEIPWAAGKRLRDIECLAQRGGGQVVVEMVGSTDREDDGYTTESDDE